ncbi:hypothetical protein [Burkholderia gladioli]|uniref:hypothetical protein n=1 Tax=Burkholderia gladioli TaxID=28095 RepID=UPI000F52BDBB|nr:hypothetical protein [Burkholderia gladioli]
MAFPSANGQFQRFDTLLLQSIEHVRLVDVREYPDDRADDEGLHRAEADAEHPHRARRPVPHGIDLPIHLGDIAGLIEARPLLGLRACPQQPDVLAHRFRAHAHLGEPAIEIRERLHRALDVLDARRDRSHLLRERGDLYRQPLLLLVTHPTPIKKKGRSGCP